MSPQAPNGIQKQQTDFVSRVYHIPLIEESLNKVVSFAKGHSLTAFFYAKGEQVAYTLLDVTKPLQDRLPLAQLNGVRSVGDKPLQALADVCEVLQFCNSCLDKVQATFPRAFEMKTDELVAHARKPADQAYSLFQQRVAGAQNSLEGVQSRLGQLTSNVPRSPEEGQKMLRAVLNEMNKAKDNLAATAQSLPANMRQNAQPYLSDLQQGLNEVSKELNNKDLPLNVRAQNAAKYIRDHAAPAFEKVKTQVLSNNNKTSAGGQQSSSYADAAAPN